MPLVRNDDLVRIDLPAEGEWVEVKRRLSRGDEIAVQKSLMAGLKLPPELIARLAERGLTAAKVGEAVMGHGIDAAQFIEGAQFATLDVAIKAWSFGETVTPEAIRALDGESIDAIITRLNEMYPGPRTDDGRKNLSGSGAAPSSAEAPSLPSLVGSQ